MTPETCPLCRCDTATVKYDLGNHQIVRCVQCGLMRLSPMPTMAETREVYSSLSYFHHANFLDMSEDNLYGYVDYKHERLDKQWAWISVAEKLYKMTTGAANTVPRLLEIGCGLGYFLDAAQDVGFEVMGAEVNPGAIKAARQKYSFPIYEGDLPEGAEPVDVVAMLDTIEHLHDPSSVLNKVHRCLQPDGVLVISTMDCESLPSRLLGKRLEDFRRTREHLFFFSRKTITAMLKAHGFEVCHIESYGHTFELAFLLSRVAGFFGHSVFMALRRVVVWLGFGRWRITVDPHLKMLVYARRVEQA